jgi:hypothetical protein
MGAYSAVPPDDPFAVSRGMFDGLAAELAGPAAAVLTACELEDLLDEKGREMVRQLLQDHYDLRKCGKNSRPGSSGLPHPVPTGSPGPGWRPGTASCWPPCSAR